MTPIVLSGATALGAAILQDAVELREGLLWTAGTVKEIANVEDYKAAVAAFEEQKKAFFPKGQIPPRFHNPIKDGDVYLVLANMTTVEKLQEPTPAPVVTPTPEPAPSDPSPEPSPTDQLESARRHMHLVRSTHA